ncbi:MAG: hypothetical protein ABJC36_00590 [Gemmatimonadales bacterium]
MTEPVFTARRRFGPYHGARWTDWVAWSGLTGVRELISLDTMLCPEAPDRLIPEDWEHNVHADYRVLHFRSLEYLTRRVAGTLDLQLLALLPNPEAEEVARVQLPGFDFAGFEVLDVHGDVSALTNCGGFPALFAADELNPFGLLDDLTRAEAVRGGLRNTYRGRPHAECDVWALWRSLPAAANGARAS